MARVQFNLLPDVKLEYLRTRRIRNLVIAISSVITIASIAILVVLLFTVEVVQKKQMNNAQKALSTANGQLDDVSNLNKIITVQNQLYTLVGLHQNKHITSRIFTYLTQVTPNQASISRLDLDTSQNTLDISGSADSQQTVNDYIDTLKATTYTVGSQDSPHPAFSSVVESDFSINASNVGFSLSMSYDPKLFANNLLSSQGSPQTPVLYVPSSTSTRSAADDPSNALFQGQTTTKATTQSTQAGQ